MALSTLDILQVICPSLYANANRDVWISIAAEETSVDYYGVFYNKAVALRAAHLFTVNSVNTDTEGGQVTSKREGDLAVSYATRNDVGSSDLSLTKYGVQLLALRRSANLPIMSLGTDDIPSDSGVGQ